MGLCKLCGKLIHADLGINNAKLQLLSYLHLNISAFNLRSFSDSFLSISPRQEHPLIMGKPSFNYVPSFLCSINNLSKIDGRTNPHV